MIALPPFVAVPLVPPAIAAAPGPEPFDALLSLVPGGPDTTAPSQADASPLPDMSLTEPLVASVLPSAPEHMDAMVDILVRSLRMLAPAASFPSAPGRAIERSSPDDAEAGGEPGAMSTGAHSPAEAATVMALIPIAMAAPALAMPVPMPMPMPMPMIAGIAKSDPAPELRRSRDVAAAEAAPGLPGPRTAVDCGLPVVPSQPAVVPSPTHVAGPDTTSSTAAQQVERQLDLGRGAVWLDSLARDIVATGTHGGRLRFALLPETLGRLDIDVRRDGGSIAIHMTAPHEAAREALTAAQPRLIDEIRAQGVRVSASEIATGAEGSGSERSGSPPRPQAPPLIDSFAEDRTTIARSRHRPADGRYA